MQIPRMILLMHHFVASNVCILVKNTRTLPLLFEYQTFYSCIGSISSRYCREHIGTSARYPACLDVIVPELHPIIMNYLWFNSLHSVYIRCSIVRVIIIMVGLLMLIFKYINFWLKLRLKLFQLFQKLLRACFLRSLKVVLAVWLFQWCIEVWIRTIALLSTMQLMVLIMSCVEWMIRFVMRTHWLLCLMDQFNREWTVIPLFYLNLRNESFQILQFLRLNSLWCNGYLSVYAWLILEVNMKWIFCIWYPLPLFL